MELVINTNGAYLRKVDERFQVTVGGVRQEFSCKKIDKILITTAALVTTDALKLAIENNIDVVFLEYNGQPFGRVWHSKLGSITTIRRNQLKLCEMELGTEFVKEWISQKIDNQINHLKKLSFNRSYEKVKLINEAVDKLEEYKEKVIKLKNVTINNIRGTLEGYEGASAKLYFKTLGQLIPEKYAFVGRSKNPAKDKFNCMLNYAYGILYSNVERSCIIAGLDPYIGIMHTDNYNKTALVFDLIEMYRAYMDEVVFGLFSKRKVKEDMFDKIEGVGYWLNKNGKQLLIEVINNRFEEKVKYKGKMIKLNNIIKYDCHNIANRILNEVS
ncbi:CRISPR-associated endonuclease Cas1 [Clostridium isatidis]|uniref:CRISPR-associated endonuclease Cas1 n=1 Tax=Clostridium isatidis TaxID=182773 RepID=A0A343JB62_9CLOT|nr:CRISPR-associated endonuclease Cas1 [Clostridium isatidis]ASW42770.1 CRISPR-associated endonuclease Cas1 [Clostridium isatidis]